jgi:hypothetical protein
VSDDPTAAGAAVTRRRFLGAAAALAAVGAGAAGAACGGGGGGGGATTTTKATVPALTGDVAVAHLVAGLEVLAIHTYDGLLDIAAAGTVGTVPALVGAVVTTARAQHGEHLAVWNRVLRGAGQPEVNVPDAGLLPILDGMLGQVADVEATARLAVLVEEILADTYLKAIPTLVDTDSVRAAALILATDQQHQAVLRFALGENPLPEPLQVPDKAAS